MFANVGGNFGQILEQGQQHRDNMRLQAEIANMRYNKPQADGHSGGSGGQSDDMHKYMKLGLEMAETRAKLDQMGEQMKKQKMEETNAHFYKIAEMAYNGNYAGAATYFRSMMGDSSIPGYEDQTYRQIFDEQTDGVFSKGAPASFGNTQYTDAIVDKIIGIGSSRSLFVDYSEQTMPQENQMQNDVGYSSEFATMEGNDKYIPGKKWKARGGNDDGLIPNIKNKIDGYKERKKNAADNLSGGQNIQAEEGDEVTLTDNPNQPKADSSNNISGVVTTEVLTQAIKTGDISNLPAEWQEVVNEVMSTTVVGTNNQGEPIIFNLSEPLSMLTAKYNEQLAMQQANQQNLLGAMMSNPLGKQARIDSNTQDAQLRQQDITADIQAMQKKTTEHMKNNFDPSKASSTAATIGELNQATGTLNTNKGIYEGGKNNKVPTTSMSVSTGSNTKEDPYTTITETNVRSMLTNNRELLAATNGKIPQTADELVEAANAYEKMHGKSFWDTESGFKNKEGKYMTWREAARGNTSKETFELLNRGEVSSLDGSITELISNPKNAKALERAKAAMLAYINLPEGSPESSAMRAAISRLTAAQFQELREKGFTPKSIQEVLLAASKASGDAPLILRGLSRHLRDRVGINNNRVLDSKKGDYLTIAYVNNDLKQNATDYENLAKYIEQGYVYIRSDRGVLILSNPKTGKRYELGPGGELAPLVEGDK